MLESSRKQTTFVLTTLAGSSRTQKNTSNDLSVVQSKVWDGKQPIPLNFPVRSVLETTKSGLRIRKLQGKIGEKIEVAARDISLDELSQTPNNLFEIPNTETEEHHSTLFLNIYPVPSTENRLRVNPLPALAVYLPEGIDRSREYRNTQVTIFSLLCLGILALQFWHPKPRANDEIIPPEYAKLLLSSTLRNRQELKKEAERKAAPAYQVAKAFQNNEVKKTTSQLFSGKAVKDLLVKSTLLSATNSKKVVHGLFSGGDLVKSLGNSAIPSAGKLGSGTNPTTEGSNGTNRYGISTSGPQVSGQGHKLLSVIPKNIEIDQGLTREEVGKIVRNHLGEVRYCYESAMVRAPSLEGKLIVSFIILENGSVEKALAKQSSGDAALDTCILEHLSKWKFPAPRGKDSVHVSYPFIFKVLDG